MQTRKMRKQISICTTLAFMMTGCGRLNPLAEVVTTSMNVEVENQTSGDLVASGTLYERVSSDECDDSYTSSGQSVLAPGDKISISISVKCLGPARTSLSVHKAASYGLGMISIRDPAIAAKFTPGLQFRVALRDYSNIMTLQVVSSPALTGSYTHFWPLAPNDALQVAWLTQEKTQTRDPQWQLHMSLPKESHEQQLYVEFDDSLGIDKFGNHLVEHENGVYRSYFWQTHAPWVYSPMSGGRLICDDIGCNEIQ